MAKSGKVIAGIGTSAALKSSVTFTEPRIGTLGAIVAAALAGAATKVFAFVDTKNRRVIVADPVAAVVDVENQMIADSEMPDMRITPDEPGKASSPFTVDPAFGTFGATAINQALIAALAPVKPKMSVSALISKIEDLASAAGKDAIVVVDQVTGVVRAYIDTPAKVADADVALKVPDANTLAEFTQTDVAADGGPKDPFE